MVAEQNGNLCTLFSHHQHAAHAHHVDAGRSHVDNLHGGLQFRARRQIDEHTILRQHRVEQRHAVVARAEITVV